MSVEESYFSNKTIDVLAEVANGGGCSIVINSILNDLPKRLANVPEKTFHKIVHLDNSFITGELVDSQEGVFKGVGYEGSLENGVPYRLGFSETTFGVLAGEYTFVPFIRMYDRRGQGNTCSYAVCDTAFGTLEDGIVSTIVDEASVILASADERGLVVVRDALLLIREFVLGEGAEEMTDLQSQVEQIFDVQKLVADITGYSPDVDYREERTLRKRLDFIAERVGGLGVHDEVLIDYNEVKMKKDDFSAKDRIEKTVVRRGLDNRGYNVITQFIFPGAQSRDPLTALDVFIGDEIGVVSLNKTIEPKKGAEAAFQLVADKVERAVSESVVKGLVLESFSPEIQQWAHVTYKDLTDHFNAQFPDYKPQFSLLIVEDEGKRRVVICDVSSGGLCLGDTSKYNYDSQRKWSHIRNDKRLQYTSSVGNKIRTARSIDEATIQAILEINPGAYGTVWLTRKSVKQPFLDHIKMVAQMSNGSYRIFGGRRWCDGSDIRVRPTVECPYSIDS